MNSTLNPPPEALDQLRSAALDSSYVSLGGRRTASVHEFYRYPARFSPLLAQSAIEAFTTIGDCVVDPFCGGGTSAVEAQLSGRAAAVADLNSLAAFVTRAKVTLYSDQSLALARAFSGEYRSQRLKPSWALPGLERWAKAGYLRNLDSPDTWRLRNHIGGIIEAAIRLDDDDAIRLVRCSLLRTGQWALDMRRDVPDLDHFRHQFESNLTSMAAAAEAHRATVLSRWPDNPAPQIVTKGLPESAARLTESLRGRPRLVLTSPPYPGVYINYHRWKVRGRRESPAPYWIANSMDGHGIAHYTMSARSGLRQTFDRYFEKLAAAYHAIASMMTQDTWLVQVVGFNDPASQFDRYLEVMKSVGLEEIKFDRLATSDDGRLWRSVPSRRWWVAAVDRADSAPSTGRETVLVHRLIR